MAEAMLGLKRTHRCTEVTTSDIGKQGYRYGMGAEEQK